MVAVVAVIGSVIMFQAMNGINDFNFYLSFLTGSNNSSNEHAIIEHVRFNPTDNKLQVWIRNTGTVQLEISKITLVNMDSQVLLLDDNPQATIFIGDSEEIVEFPTSIVAWQDPPNDTSEYRISISTISGNSFETTARPFNT